MSSEITLVVMLVAAVAVATFVAWPLLTGKSPQDAQEGAPEEESPLEDLLVQKEATYAAIKELEFDHAMGNLSNRDYEELAGRYEDKAVALLKIIDEASEREGPFSAIASAPPVVVGVQIGRPRGGRLEDAIEREVAALRGGGTRNHGKPTTREEEMIEREVAAMRQPKKHRGDLPAPAAGSGCPGCGAPLRNPGAAFCPKCGTSLQLRCPVCGEPAEESDRFCSACGGPLARHEETIPGKPVVGGGNA